MLTWKDAAMTNLVGMTTPGGWLIGEPVTFAADHTGGYHSACFRVAKGGETAFLKALDIEKFDISTLVWHMSGFQYESDLLGHCKTERLNRIVRVLEAGHVERGPEVSPVLRKVPFMVLELAKEGDIRKTVDISTSVSDQWRFFVLHQTTLALLQLHAQSIAHQDLKPSNVLNFGANRLKLGDLGRSSRRGFAAPHDGINEPGARNYSPFEQRYGNPPGDWVERRLSTDVFHLGCFVVFAFTNICFSEYVMEHLADPYRPSNWGSSYAEVMPHVQAASAAALNDVAHDFPSRFRDRLVQIILDLCNPDPTLRGRTGLSKKSTIGLLWLQRYASRFDILEKEARIRLVPDHV